jgi:hypothetical protein
MDETIATFELDGTHVELTEDAVWATLARGGFSKTAAVVERFEALYSLGKALNEPRGLARIVPISRVPTNDRANVPEPIRDAEFLAFCISTAGRSIDEKARTHCEAGELIESMIVDAIAMAGLSQIGDRLGREIFAWAADRGLAASRSFSPGAGASHWGLEHQQVLFRYLPERPLGIELTASFLMKPSKSVSFVIGIGGAVKQATHPFSCEGCERLDCAYRHIPDAEMVRGESHSSEAPVREASQGGRP